MTFHQRVALGALSLALLSRSSGAQATATSQQICARRDSLARNTPGTSIDDAFEVAARLLPGGFGGLTTTYFFLKQPALVDTARGISGAGGVHAGRVAPSLGDRPARRRPARAVRLDRAAPLVRAAPHHRKRRLAQRGYRRRSQSSVIRVCNIRRARGISNPC